MASSSVDFSALFEAVERVKAQAASEGGVPIGSYRCDCGTVRDWDAPPCECEIRKKAEAELAKRRAGLRRAYESIPNGLGFCRINDPRWEAIAIHAKAKELAFRWNRRRGSVLLLGKTGAGKTVSAAALMHRILDVAANDGISVVDYAWARRMRFVSAPSLAIARRNCGLGDESPLVEEAMRASLLVLDELGFEWFDPARDTTLFEVLDHRYLENKPTIVTSGRRLGELKERYGDAILRRITDRGYVADLWEGA